MEKFKQLVKPFLSFIIGGLVILYFMNLFNSGMPALITLAIIGIVVGAFYIVYGVLNSLLGDKFPSKVLSPLLVIAFPVLAVIKYLILVIVYANGVSAAGWIINIALIVAALAFVLLYALVSFVKGVSIPGGILKLCGYIFALVLVITILFDIAGGPNLLGQIDVINAVVIVSYFGIMLPAIAEKK